MKTEPLRGVNLGGWLVLEKWITPSLFRGTSASDEYTYCLQADTQQLQRLRQFRDQFITKPDFVWLVEHGINTVRLPVGYWLFGGTGTEPYVATVRYVDKAFEWAEQTGIQILLDLHGAPGSQNGKDHSGKIGETNWGGKVDDIAQTLDIIRRLAKRYGNHPALLGISLLNEPGSSLPKSVLLDYYEQAYAIIRKQCGDDVLIVYSDGYAPRRWRKDLPGSRFVNVAIDTHHYQVFTALDKKLPPWLSLLRTRWQLPFNLARFKRHHPVVVGEWSLTLGSTALQKHAATKQTKTTRQYGRLQLQAFRTAAAWFFWTYKTEAGGRWSFRDSVEAGLLDQQLLTENEGQLCRE